ncbi:unnamed protein product [Malus baccata var. baccata]
MGSKAKSKNGYNLDEKQCSKPKSKYRSFHYPLGSSNSLTDSLSSPRKLRRKLKNAMKEEEKICRTAEKIVKWAK